jgi:hypothetical protein
MSWMSTYRSASEWHREYARRAQAAHLMYPAAHHERAAEILGRDRLEPAQGEGSARAKSYPADTRLVDGGRGPSSSVDAVGSPFNVRRESNLIRAIRPYRWPTVAAIMDIDLERSAPNHPEMASTGGASRDCIKGRHVRDRINDRWERSLRVVRRPRCLDGRRQHQRNDRHLDLGPKLAGRDVFAGTVEIPLLDGARGFESVAPDPV